MFKPITNAVVACKKMIYDTDPSSQILSDILHNNRWSVSLPNQALLVSDLLEGAELVSGPLVVWKKLITKLEISPNDIAVVVENSRGSFKWRNIDIAHELVGLRQQLDVFIKEWACKEIHSTHNGERNCDTSCISSGNEERTSDIDITVKGNCWDYNLYRLIAMRKYLQIHLFGKDTVWRGNLKKIFLFFDINFYLSNFAVLYPHNNNSNQLNSYILTNDLILQVKHIEDNTHNTKNTTDNSKEYFNAVQDAHCTLQNLFHDNKQYLANTFIDQVSKIALFKDECYVTQGAFIHVVCMMQQRKPFHKNLPENLYDIFHNFMICSILENLQFAISHAGKSRGKYLMRVLDANYNRQYGNHDWKKDNINNLLQDLFKDERGFTHVEYVKDVQNRIESLHNKRFNGTAKNILSQEEDVVKSKLIDISETTIDNVYNNIMDMYLPNSQMQKLGGANQQRKLLDKAGMVVKKDIQGRMCVIYVDKDRRQYVKKNNKYICLQEARKTSSKGGQRNKRIS